MIFRFRIVLDAEEDIFRDLELENSSTFEDLHNAIIQSFGLSGHEMATFYVTDDEWNQGEEISLFDLSEGGSDIQLMSQTVISSVVSEERTKLIYVYDFMSMWTFMVELGEIVEEAQGTDYPNLLYVHGQVPSDAPEKVFEAEGSEDHFDEFEDDYSTDDYEHLDFDENWN